MSDYADLRITYSKSTLDEGDIAEVDFDTAVVRNLTRGTEIML